MTHDLNEFLDRIGAALGPAVEAEGRRLVRRNDAAEYRKGRLDASDEGFASDRRTGTDSVRDRRKPDILDERDWLVGGGAHVPKLLRG